jgi:hypothetical protein
MTVPLTPSGAHVYKGQYRTSQFREWTTNGSTTPKSPLRRERELSSDGSVCADSPRRRHVSPPRLRPSRPGPRYHSGYSPAVPAKPRCLVLAGPIQGIACRFYTNNRHIEFRYLCKYCNCKSLYLKPVGLRIRRLQVRALPGMLILFRSVPILTAWGIFTKYRRLSIFSPTVKQEHLFDILLPPYQWTAQNIPITYDSQLNFVLVVYNNVI